MSIKPKLCKSVEEYIKQLSLSNGTWWEDNN